MPEIINPILRGFNPDPSIVRVESDYYIATSTFEWFPGVQIHHSKDLINWKLIVRPLNRQSQLDMRGNGDSCGVWAPCLTFNSGLFYLVYSDVKSCKGGYFDLNNYLVTATSITGEWSEPIYLNSCGFDPSLFHDEDGSKWIVGHSFDNSRKNKKFDGIILQQYSSEEKRLVGKEYKIFEGTELGVTEGPHIYKKHGYYYLITAEGGTGLRHAVTMARSRNLTGPYEVDPQNPVLTAAHDPFNPLQKAGHADLVETAEGETYMVHLCSRPLPVRGKSILGRETCIQKVVWNEDKWLRLEAGDNKPQMNVPSPNIQVCKWEDTPRRDDFTNPELGINFQTLRVPLEEDMLSLRERHGYLRLKGRESLCSNFYQSLVARRQENFRYTASTCVEFEPDTSRQMAGLVCYYNTQNYFYLRITSTEGLGKTLSIISCDNCKLQFYPGKEVCINGWDRIYLKVKVDYHMLQFYYSQDGKIWSGIGAILDASILSDEHAGVWGFTGAFVGLCCQDLSGRRKHADFDYFEYIPLE